ncbi:Aste57867_18347 [Aphanomyces stellatus]|uniref:Aste57867_18347 protein n=1 Tax=Aphanomyces stellatus TaxID=120398 RepID=A0A485LBK9_9STRA|nr:hypothetical protein As57867_018285 [Aphanomyces stellatus]VFT95083.1 Aste57867_18347 [Aphanomyces stellatus]
MHVPLRLLSTSVMMMRMAARGGWVLSGPVVLRRMFASSRGETVLPSSSSSFSLEEQQRILRVVQHLHDVQGSPRWTHLTPSFVVPDDHAAWPSDLHGTMINLTQLRKEKREQRLAPAIEAGLDAVGVEWSAHAQHWRETLLALETYESLHGDLLVPKDFIIPASSPSWPPQLWGKKLGHVVCALRTRKPPLETSKRTALDALGFVWGVRARQWDMQLLALQTFQAQHGHLRVPASFVVPDGDPTWPPSTWKKPLGSVVARLRQDRDSLDESKKAALDALGLAWKLRDRSAAVTLPMKFTKAKQLEIVEIARYVYTHQGHDRFTTLSPAEFKVPPSWPEQLQGGSFNVSNFRRAYKKSRLAKSTIAALDAIRFVWDAKEHESALNVEALALYKAMYGDMLVGQDFIVPHEAPWPIYLYGKKLGAAVSNLRKRASNLPAGRRQVLDDMGFVWGVQDAAFEFKVKALGVHQAIVGHVAIPPDFVVPANDPAWPADLWGKHLGHMVDLLRRARSTMPAARRAHLDALGFEWEPWASAWALKVRALETYKAHHGHLWVPKDFVVPAEDRDWPVDLWHKKLGQDVVLLRQAAASMPSERRATLTAMGFIWDALEATWQRKLQALALYHARVGDLHMKREFVIPAQDPAWPMELWGLRLGMVVHNLRHTTLSDERRGQLDAMGFPWRVA